MLVLYGNKTRVNLFICAFTPHWTTSVNYFLLVFFDMFSFRVVQYFICSNLLFHFSSINALFIVCCLYIFSFNLIFVCFTKIFKFIGEMYLFILWLFFHCKWSYNLRFLFGHTVLNFRQHNNIRNRNNSNLLLLPFTL